MQDTYNEASDNKDHEFVPFRLCNVGGCHELDLRNMICIDNQSTVEFL